MRASPPPDAQCASHHSYFVFLTPHGGIATPPREGRDPSRGYRRHRRRDEGQSGHKLMARPEGSGRALATYRVPIEGRDEWLAAARHLA